MWYHELLQKASRIRAELSTEDRWKLIEQYFLGNESYVAQVRNLSE